MSEQQTLDQNSNDEKNSFVCFANLLENFQKGDVSSLPLPHTLDYLLEVVPVSLPILKGRLQALIQSLVREHASLQQAKESDDIISLSDGFSSFLRCHFSHTQYQNLCWLINRNTINWLHTLMRLPLSTGDYFLRTFREARLAVARDALMRKYKSYNTEGYLCFTTNPPVLYSTRSGYYVEELRFGLGLPHGSISLISGPGDLKNKIRDDVEAGKVPFMLLAVAGDEDTGKSDDIGQLHSICHSNEIWFHVEGQLLAYLALPSVPANLQPVIHADSFLFNAAQFLKQENYVIPTVFHRRTKPASPSGSNLVESSSNPTVQMNPTDQFIDHGPLTLNLWFMLQLKGAEQLKIQFESAFKKVSTFHSKLSSIKNSIVIESPEISDRVVFRYLPLSESEQILERVDIEFLNRVNEQVLSDLNVTGTADQVLADLDLDLVTVHHVRYIRFKPLYSGNLDKINALLINAFVTTLNKEISLIDATISQRRYFKEVVCQIPGLLPVEVSNFVGLGAVRYIPVLFAKGHQAGRLKEELDKLNNEVAEHLQTIHEIYRPAVDINGFKCIALSVDTSPIAREKVEYYARLIHKHATEKESASNLNEVFAEILKQGIKKAEEALKKETQSSYDEGFLHKIPLVGSMWSWWSPPHQRDVTGKTFDPLSQQLESKSPPSPSHKKFLENSGGSSTPLNLSQSSDFRKDTIGTPLNLSLSQSVDIKKENAATRSRSVSAGSDVRLENSVEDAGDVRDARVEGNLEISLDQSGLDVQNLENGPSQVNN